MEEKTWCVYIHTSPSNKKYVGITSKNPKERWKNGNGYPHNQHFTNAIKKYGWENFTHEIVATGLTEEAAQQMEVELVAQYNTFDSKYGYNQTSGGEKGKQHSQRVKDNQRKLAKELWQNDEYRQAQIERMKLQTGDKNPNYGNHKLAGENHPNYGKHLSEETRSKISLSHLKRSVALGKRDSLEKPVKVKRTPEESRKQMSESHKARWNDELRAEWSQKFSGEGNGMYGKHHTEETKRKLSEMFSGEKHPQYGRKHTEEELQKMHNSSPTKIRVVQLTLDGDYVNTYNSYTYAAKSVGGEESSICECCNGNLRSAYGYMWIKESEYDPNRVIKYENPVFKKVVQLDVDMNFIAEYVSLAEAERMTNTRSQNIGKACRTGSIAKGSHWMYKEDYDKLVKIKND